MATTTAEKMNLTVVQQHDPYITSIVDSASQVALYSFNAQKREWEKTEVEGTLFLYARSAEPFNGFMILNRLGMSNLIEPLNKNLEFQLQDPFLLYKNDKSSIYGVWFYDKDECTRLGQLMNGFVQLAIESRSKKKAPPLPEADMARPPPTLTPPTHHGTNQSHFNTVETNGVDIMQMLLKAQREYNQGQIPAEPKPMINNVRASATKSDNDLIKPEPQKIIKNNNEVSSLEALFQRASQRQDATPNNNSNNLSEAQTKQKSSLQISEKSSAQAVLQSSSSSSSHSIPHSVPLSNAPASSDVQSLLKKLMAKPGTSVEAIENQHVTQSNISTRNDSILSSTLVNHDGPQSPDTALKRTLNILPSGPSTTPTASTAGTVAIINGTSTHMSSAISPMHGVKRERLGSKLEKLNVTAKPISSAKVLLTPQAFESSTNPLNKSSPLLATSTGQAGVVNTSSLRGLASAASTNTTPLRSETARVYNNAGMMASLSASLNTSRTTTSIGSLRIAEESTLSSSLPSSAIRVGSIVHDPLNRPTLERKQVAALTEPQMKQAMLYMIENDSEFLHKLHEAYIKSLQAGLGGL